jgi:hypothetical protein
MVRGDLDPEAVTPVEVRHLSCDCAGKGLDITVGFSTTNKFLSRVIRWITRGKVSHSWIAYDDFTLGLRMVMQAEAWAFEVRPWQRWIKENKWMAEFRMIDGSQHSALRRRARDLGSKYDWKSGLLVGISAWFKRWWKSRFRLHPDRTPKKLMCSEAVVRFLKDAGCKCVRELDEELTSPVELYDIVRCSTEFTAVKRAR